MNRRRELALQRVSRIGGLTAVDSYQQNAKHKGSSAYARTIEAALGTYLMKDHQVYDLRGQDTYTRSYGDAGSDAQEQLARQMKEYVSVAEESQLANAKSDLERRAADHIHIKKFEEALAKDPSAQYQFSRYHKIEDETDFDWLDANRCSGFLLYSYNKKGIHSVLGEQYSSGNYGGTFAAGY
ncbi:MAG: hypothetical protein K2O40_13155 [Lachnospiraceae bacterium]|nr:hypothetical protein [Lachnospiraceae bacterium]MDE7185379.1 hypothetical protein [Lachnospiraceae bacterium]